MIVYSKEMLEQIILDACPRCKDAVPLVYRPAYDEWTHTKHSIGKAGGNVSHTICMATHLRVKYKDLLGG